jgi:hypothetical protein
VPEGQPMAGPKNLVWASKILVTGPNGKMVAHKLGKYKECEQISNFV